MSVIPILFAAFGTGLFGWYLWQRRAPLRRREFIRGYPFPAAVDAQVKKEYPFLTADQRSQVLEGLKDYLEVCGIVRLKKSSMPSKVVDSAWHQFILDTREYLEFCHRAYGHFLHHYPAESMPAPTLAQEGIKRTWRIACRLEGIDPRHPSRLPRLFSLDADLNIPDGYRYALDCTKSPKPGQGSPDAYCATHIGCSSCGGGGDGGCGGGGDGGCGGGGCGGGGD